MPRININEKDNTSPGTPSGYSNNTVLIAGFSAYTDEDIKTKAIKADDNGIFEFTSAGDFENTIGLVAPVIQPIEDGEATAVSETETEPAEPVEHYGNQMAYELLKMGYPVIYINLGLPYDVDDEGEMKDPAETMKKLGDEATWEIFKDRASYDFRFVSHGLLTSCGSFAESDFADANTAIANLAHYKAVTASDGTEDEMAATSGRGDCVALIEVDESKYSAGEGRPEHRIVNAINEMADIKAENGKYCACTVPSVVYKMTANAAFNNNKKFPGAFHYLACFKNSLDLGFAEWYAAAGYTRGVSSYTIDFTTVKLGEIAINALEPRHKKTDGDPKFAVNVIANFRGSYYLWGNRTCHPLGEAAGGNDLVASHFLNIRQLCTTIKKQLYVSCRRFTFDPNSDVLWINFKNSIIPMLDRMKADQGVRDYKIEKVYTDKKATLKARIRIVPIEAVEDFLLEVSLEDSLGETAVTIAE